MIKKLLSIFSPIFPPKNYSKNELFHTVFSLSIVFITFIGLGFTLSRFIQLTLIRQDKPDIFGVISLAVIVLNTLTLLVLCKKYFAGKTGRADVLRKKINGILNNASHCLSIALMFLGMIVFLVVDFAYIGTTPDSFFVISQKRVLGLLVYFFLLLLSFEIVLIIFSVKNRIYIGRINKKLLTTSFYVKVIVWFSIYFPLMFYLYNQYLLDYLNRTRFPFKLFTIIGICIIGIVLFVQIFPYMSLVRLQDNPKKKNIIKLVYSLVFILIVVCGHIAFGSNDDPEIMAIASGGIDGIPDPHLVFTNVIIGYVLNGLYRFAGQVNWYGIYLLFALYVSGIIFIDLLFSYFKKQWGIALIVFSISFVYFLFTINFTSVAILTSIAGWMLLINVYDSGKSKIIGSIFAILFIFIGSLIRLPGGYLAFILFLPLLLYMFFKKKIYLLLIPIVLSIAAVGIGIKINNSAYYRDPDWADYKEFNQLRGNINATPRAGSKLIPREFWYEIGWRESGHLLFNDWFFIDPDVFTIQSLKTINLTYPYLFNNLETLKVITQMILKNCVPENLSFITLAIYAFIKVQKKTKVNIILLCFGIGYYLAIIILIAVFQRMPIYVYKPIIFMVNFLLLFFIFQFPLDDGRIIRNSTLRKCLLSLAFLQIVLIIQIDQTNLFRAEYYREIVDYISRNLSFESKPLVIEQGGAFPSDWRLPFDDTTLPYNRLTTGWIINSPPYNNLLHEYGISNLATGLIGRKDVYVLGWVKDDFISYLRDVKNIQVNTTFYREIPIITKGLTYLDIFQLGYEETK